MKKIDTGQKQNSEGSSSKVTSTFLEHGSFLRAFIKKFLKLPQDIEDIAQEAYVRAFKAEQSAEVEHPKALLFTVAKNIALNELQTKARRVTDYIEECQLEKDEPISASLEEDMQALDGLETYCGAVDSLPEQCRRVYLLRKVHGLSHKEIASHLNITVRSVERHLQKGVLRCRNYIKEKDSSNAKQQMVGSPSVTTTNKQRVR